MSSPKAQESQQTLERIISERREKVGKLRESGRNPYRNDLRPSGQCAEVRRKYEGTRPEEPTPGITPVDGEVISLAGRVVARRGFGKTTFMPLRDGSGELQLFLNVDHTDSDSFGEVLPLVDVGDIVWAEGQIFWTKRGELSLLTKKLRIISKSLRPLPDKWHGLTDVETRYRQRYLDLATNPEVREVFRKRSQIVAGIRRFLDERGFLEVETPMMHPIIGGAAARPFTTHHNALDMELFMRIAPELYLKRLVVGGFERVYEINRNFRNEGLSRQHNPEFTMLEFYWAYATYHDLMELTEELIVGLAEEVNGRTTVTWDGHDIDLARPWKRLSVKEAVLAVDGMPAELFDNLSVAAGEALQRGIKATSVADVLLEHLGGEFARTDATQGDRSWFDAQLGKSDRRDELIAKIEKLYRTPKAEDLDAEPLDPRVVAAHIGYLIFDEFVESTLVQPTFLTGFPLAVSPLARKSEDDPVFCDRFELFVAGKEIANAFSELNDPDDQRSRFEAQLRARESGADETMDYDEDYCRALELGMPSAAGEGIGIDRLTMMLTGQDSIRDVILFPLMRPEM